MGILKNRHVFLGCLLLAAAGAMEAVVYCHFQEWRASPVVINSFMRIFPVYNDSGSWIYGRLGIEYSRFRLMLENMIAIGVELLFFRFIDSLCLFFQMKRWVLYAVDFGITALVYRLLIRIRGVFPLDYLHIRGHGVYDLPDGYIFVAVAGVLIWFVPFMIAYYSYKRKEVKGMSFWQKTKWEFGFCGIILKATVLSAGRRAALFEEWKL